MPHVKQDHHWAVGSYPLPPPPTPSRGASLGKAGGGGTLWWEKEKTELEEKQEVTKEPAFLCEKQAQGSDSFQRVQHHGGEGGRKEPWHRAVGMCPEILLVEACIVSIYHRKELGLELAISFSPPSRVLPLLSCIGERERGVEQEHTSSLEWISFVRSGTVCSMYSRGSLKIELCLSPSDWRVLTYSDYVCPGSI